MFREYACGVGVITWFFDSVDLLGVLDVQAARKIAVF